MKINLTIRGQTHNGFLNLDPTSQPQDTDRVMVDLFKLEDMIDANEAELILINDVMDYLPLPVRGKFLSGVLTRVAHDGEVFISGLDLYQASRVIHTGELAGIEQANAVLYGQQVSKKSAVTPQDVLSLIQQTGQFEIVEMSYSGIQYVIKARRK